MNDLQLSKNFKLSEFVFSNVAADAGIDNTPTVKQIKNMTVLCLTVLQPIRDALGPVEITSGFRSSKLNKHPLVGGSPNSHHRCHSGYAAADFKVRGVFVQDVVEWIRDSPLPFEQLISEPTWVHISSYLHRPKREIMKATHEGGKMVYTLI